MNIGVAPAPGLGEIDLQNGHCVEVVCIIDVHGHELYV